MGAQARLLSLIQRRLGAEGPSELARALGLTDFSAPTRVGRWLREEHEPKLGEVILMLERAKLLKPEAIAAWRGGSGPVDRGKGSD